jgi:peptidoglycan hydrolase-like protein with peptidoglycan-binding domain
MIGTKTRRAIAQEQKNLGVEADGRAGLRILEALRPVGGN